MRRRLADRTLRRWLRTGQPGRVAGMVEADPEVGSRLEAMSRLDHQTTQTLQEAVAPSGDFAERTTRGVVTRLDTYRALGLVGDLLGVGWRTGQVLFWDTSGVPPDPHLPSAEADPGRGGS